MTKKILIIAPSWVGDCVMSQSLLFALKNRDNECVIDVFCPKWAMSVYKHMTQVNKVIENPFGHGAIELKLRYRLGRMLRQEKYDEVYILPGSIKSALVPFFAKIPQRIGYLGEKRYVLLNNIHYLDERKLVRLVDRFSALAFHDHDYSIEKTIAPFLVSSKEEQDQVRLELRLDKTGKILALCPGAEYGPAKRWPTQYFAEIAKKLAQKGFQVWILGSQKDHDIGVEIVQKSGVSCDNLCGKTSLSQVIDLIAQSDLVLCNDSGLMHIAASLDIPLLAFYGSSSPDYTPPVSTKARLVSLSLDCSPCFERKCPLGHTDCLVKMTPDWVWKKASLDDFLR